MEFVGTDLRQNSQSAFTSWERLVMNFTTAPVQAGTATLSGKTGSVFSYTWQGTTRFRFVPDSPYDAACDAFYTSFAGGVLSGFIVARG